MATINGSVFRHPIEEILSNLKVDVVFEPFGSRFTGLNTETSDIDLICAVDSIEACNKLAKELIARGLTVSPFYAEVAEKMVGDGYAACSHQAPARGEFCVAKFKQQGYPNVDIIVVSEAEKRRRMKTLAAIRKCVSAGDSSVVEFIKAAKGNRLTYEALFAIVDAATKE